MNSLRRYLRINGFVVFYFLPLLTGWGQIYKLDSLLNQYDAQTTYFYLKPTVGLHWSYMTRQGDPGFRDAHAFDLRNSRYGLLVGYHVNAVTLESGLTTLPIYTGHQFIVDPGFVVGSGLRITYWQIPINIQYKVWQFTKQLTLDVLTGLAFNSELGDSFLPPTYQTTFGKTNPDGSQTTTQSTVTSVYRKSFFSASLGFTLNCQLVRHLDLNIWANRLFSSNSIVNQTAQLHQGGSSSIYNVSTKAGASGLSVLLGVTYRFRTTKNYRLRDRQAY